MGVGTGAGSRVFGFFLFTVGLHTLEKDVPDLEWAFHLNLLTHQETTSQTCLDIYLLDTCRSSQIDNREDKNLLLALWC